VDGTGLARGWRLIPATAPRDARPDALRAAARLAEALHVGHAWAARPRLALTSGPRSGAWLGAADPTTARWLARVLVPAYGPGLWAPSAWPDPPSDVVGAGSTASRRRGFPEPLTDPGETGSRFDRLAAAMATAPPGASALLDLAPVPTRSTLRWGGGDAPTTPHRSPRELGPRPPIRADPGPGPHVPMVWTVRLEIRFDRRSAALAARPGVLRAAEGALRTLRGNGLRFASRARWGRGDSRGVPVEAAEIVAFWPTADCPTSGEPEPFAPTRETLTLGRTVLGIPVGTPVEPLQGRHLAVLGETGMGKSSLLVALAQRAARLGDLVVLDPIGETAETIRRELIGAGRRDLVWVSARRGTPSLNALDGVATDGANPVRSERRLNDLVHALRRVRAGRYAESGFWGPRLEEMVTRAVRAAALEPGGTLVDAHTLLATGARSPRASCPEALDAARELGARIRERPDDAEGARRLLYEIARSPVLSAMVAARAPSVRTAELLAPGRSVLVSGDAAEVGESTARYLLAVYLAIVWSELLARGGDRKVFVVLDEAQWFAHESLAEMLRLGRRRNAHVVLATQAIGSLPDGVRDAVWTNVADFVAFRGSPEEAREFARVARGVAPESILALPRGHAAFFEGKGGRLRWLRTARRPTPAEPDEPAAVAPGPTSPAAEEPRDVDEVLAWIRARAPAAPGEPVTVSLDELRRACAPAREVVRRVGGLLGRCGALVAASRGPDGAHWTVDLDRIPDRGDPDPPDAAPSAASPPQPS